MCRRGPLTVADDGQSGAVNDAVQAGARAGAPKREGAMLTASRERGVIGCREIDAQHPGDRCQEALGLTQRSVEEETERQGGFDGELGILELPAPPADASRCPRGDRVGREPEGDVASPHEGSVVLGPVPDAIRCRVLRMHSRLHIEIMTRRRSRWSTCRPLLAHRAESAHQRHPTRLLLDEIDEMELSILEAAQGQPMDRNGVQAQTVMSSTHQYPDGTVTAMRRRAAELGWPVSEWCYRETLAPHGWLTEDQVVRKQAELSRTMWAVEYELQEPSAEGRAIDPAAVERMFDATLGTHISAGDLEHLWRGQSGPPAERACPDPAGAWYCTGIDWAQKRHYTVAAVVRCDTTPLQVVAGYRIQRRPWPEMTERVGALLDEFPGPAVHDATGAGSAIGEFQALEAHRQLQGVTMVGRDRVDLFRNYIAAIERHEIVCPRIDVFYTEHLYCGEDDLFGSGHPPDTVVAMALAYHAFKTGRRPGDYGVTL